MAFLMMAHALPNEMLMTSELYDGQTSIGILSLLATPSIHNVIQTE